MENYYRGRKKELKYKKITDFNNKEKSTKDEKKYIKSFIKKFILQTVISISLFGILYSIKDSNNTQIKKVKQLIKNTLEYNIEMSEIKNKISEVKSMLIPEKLEDGETSETMFSSSEL